MKDLVFFLVYPSVGIIYIVVNNVVYSGINSVSSNIPELLGL